MITRFALYGIVGIGNLCVRVYLCICHTLMCLVQVTFPLQSKNQKRPDDFTRPDHHFLRFFFVFQDLDELRAQDHVPRELRDR